MTELLQIVYLEKGILYELHSYEIPANEGRKEAVEKVEGIFVDYMHKVDSQLISNPEKDEIIKDALDKGYYEMCHKDVFLWENRLNTLELIKGK